MRQNGEKKNGGVFEGRCYACKQPGHKKGDCPRNKATNGDEFVFSVTTATSDSQSVWLLDSGASCHMTGDVGDFAWSTVIFPSLFRLQLRMTSVWKPKAVAVFGSSQTMSGPSS